VIVNGDAYREISVVLGGWNGVASGIVLHCVDDQGVVTFDRLCVEALNELVEPRKLREL
jgi:hypothetical protein